MHNYIFNKFHDNIFQGDAITATQLVCTPKYKELGITAVLCPAYNVDLPYHGDLAILKLPLDDNSTIEPAHLDLAVAFYQLTGRKLFIHCLGGKNRSIAFSAFFLTIEGMEFEKAWKLAKKYTQPDCPYEELKTSMKNWFNAQDEAIQKRVSP